LIQSANQFMRLADGIPKNKCSENVVTPMTTEVDQLNLLELSATAACKSRQHHGDDGQ
jgi:hypothetical protein